MLYGNHTALARYYARLHQPYSQQFSRYCEKWGFDDESIADEFGLHYTESIFEDFADEFPVFEHHEDDPYFCKEEYMYNILTRCYNNPDDEFRDIKPLPFHQCMLYDTNSIDTH